MTWPEGFAGAFVVAGALVVAGAFVVAGGFTVVGGALVGVLAVGALVVLGAAVAFGEFDDDVAGGSCLAEALDVPTEFPLSGPTDAAATATLLGESGSWPG